MDCIVTLDNNHVSTLILCNFGISEPRSSEQQKIGMACDVTKNMTINVTYSGIL
jgi:hypothetical protein